MVMNSLRRSAVIFALLCTFAKMSVAQTPIYEERGAAKWAIAIGIDPVVLSSQDNSVLNINTYSPKKIITVGFIRIYFLKDSATVQSSSRMPTEGLAIGPGDDAKYIYMPPTLIDAAKKAGANRLRVDLIMSGVVRSSDSAAIDYDLSCEPTAEPNSGSGSLQVQLHANAQGGISPYTYEWYFYGDTGASTDEGPTHYYEKPGYYAVGVVVTDSMGGTVWGQTEIEVGCPIVRQ